MEQKQDEEVGAIYRSGPHSLSDGYKKIEVYSVKWYSMDPEAQIKHVECFWRYRLTLDDQFDKPKLSSRKPSDSKLTRNPDVKSAFDLLAKRKIKAGNHLPSRILAPRKRYRMSYSFVDWYSAWFINVRKTLGISYFRVKVLPIYIHFKAKCLKEDARRIHNLHYEAFPFSDIAFGKEILARSLEEVKFFLEETSIDMSNNQDQSFLHNVFIVC